MAKTKQGELTPEQIAQQDAEKIKLAAQTAKECQDVMNAIATPVEDEKAPDDEQKEQDKGNAQAPEADSTSFVEVGRVGNDNDVRQTPSNIPIPSSMMVKEWKMNPNWKDASEYKGKKLAKPQITRQGWLVPNIKLRGK